MALCCANPWGEASPSTTCSAVPGGALVARKRAPPCRDSPKHSTAPAMPCAAPRPLPADVRLPRAAASPRQQDGRCLGRGGPAATPVCLAYCRPVGSRSLADRLERLSEGAFPARDTQTDLRGYHRSVYHPGRARGAFGEHVGQEFLQRPASSWSGYRGDSRSCYTVQDTSSSPNERRVFRRIHAAETPAPATARAEVRMLAPGGRKGFSQLVARNGRIPAGGGSR